MREAWHTAATRVEQSRDVLVGILVAQVFERWKFGRAAAQIRLVAGGAICNIETFPRHFRRGRFLLRHAQDPSHLVCVHIKKPSVRVEGTSAPFRATVEPREDDGPFLRTRNERRVTYSCQRYYPKSLSRKIMSRSGSELVFRPAPSGASLQAALLDDNSIPRIAVRVDGALQKP